MRGEGEQVTGQVVYATEVQCVQLLLILKLCFHSLLPHPLSLRKEPIEGCADRRAYIDIRLVVERALDAPHSAYCPPDRLGIRLDVGSHEDAGEGKTVGGGVMRVGRTRTQKYTGAEEEGSGGCAGVDARAGLLPHMQGGREEMGSEYARADGLQGVLDVVGGGWWVCLLPRRLCRVHGTSASDIPLVEIDPEHRGTFGRRTDIRPRTVVVFADTGAVWADHGG